MLIMTVAMVRVSHAGMNTSGRLVPALDTLVAPLEKRETPQQSAAKPTMMIVISMSRRVEDLLGAAIPCEAP
jgi:hypothetical protein